MDSERADGTALTLRVAQLALLVRLSILLLIALVWALQRQGPSALVVLLAATVSYLALRYPQARVVLAQHPLLVVLDVVVLAAVVGVVGVDTPFVLALATSALLVGLWLPALSGAVVILTLLALHLNLLVREDGLTPQSVTAFALIIPALFITLWLLGMAIRRSASTEAAAQSALREAMALAATSQERGRIAREMHDTVAKSLQAMALTASSVPLHLERRPELAAERARELEEDCTLVIAQVRELMSELRSPAPITPFWESVQQLVGEWRTRTGRRCVSRIDKVDVTDSLVRYELLMALGEALDNVDRHAGRCVTRVALSGAGDTVVLRVTDEGAGADPVDVAAAPERGHFGVAGMRERLERVGGTFTHESVPGRGTTVTLTVHQHGLVEREGSNSHGFRVHR